MIESPQPMLCVWGPDRLMFYNESYSPMIGNRHPRAFGQPFFDVWPEIEVECGEMFRRVFDGESVQMDDIGLVLDRGQGPQKAHFSFSYTPVRNDDGSVDGLFCICNETTEQVFAQECIKRARDRQKEFMQQMPGFMAVLSGADHVFEYVNDAYDDLTGSRSAIGQRVRESFPALENQDFLRLLDEAFDEGRTFSRRAVPIHLHTDSEPRFIDVILQPIRDDAGQITGVFAGGYDVTHAERALRALHSTERMLAALVASSDDAIISKNIDGVITSWNAGAVRIFGYESEEIVGQPISVLACAGGEDEMPAILERLRRGERIDHFETVRRHKDGSTVFISLTVSPIHDDQGRIIGASKVARDITAARSSAQALKRTQDRLQEQYRQLLHAARLGELGLMTATLAHEINQPLSAIINYLHAAKRLASMDDRAQQPTLDEAIQRATEQALRAAEVVRRLRDFARPNPGKPETLSLNPLVEEAVALAAIDAGRRGVRVTLALGADVGLVLTDRVEIQQVLLNLVRNALEAMEGTLRRELTVSTTARLDSVEVAVADTGAGLASHIREQLFQPFVTTKGDGMGLGLSICRKIVEAHNGALWMDDRPGGGSVFKFTLPTAPMSRMDPPSSRAEAPLTACSA